MNSSATLHLVTGVQRRCRHDEVSSARLVHDRVRLLAATCSMNPRHEQGRVDAEHVRRRLLDGGDATESRVGRRAR